ncbi:MAG: alpha/beta-hydrolase family protein, partial [Candidatus Nanopelagicales bacterium]
ELGTHRDDRGGDMAEDLNRTVNPAVATGIGLAVSGALLGLATVESRLTRLWGIGVTKVLGGAPEDHRTAARVLAAVATTAVAAGALKLVDSKLGSAGEGMEPAHAEPPDIPEITGSPVSGRSWADQSREGRRWLSMVLRPEGISGVMGEPAQAQPIRIYSSLQSSSTEEGRAQVLLDEIDRTKALERPYVALWSPTGSGYVNYVACETFEYLTRGNCASMAIEYSVLPSSLSLTDVKRGTNQTSMVFAGIASRLAKMDPARRPRMFLFGESLGSQVSEEMFEGQGVFGPEGLNLEAALWIGTPEATKWRQQIWGQRSVSEPPAVGPGSLYLPRWIGDWRDLPPSERAKVRYLLLQNGDDPIPKFWFEVLWRRPAWLGPQAKRPPGSPRGTTWVPVTTFFMTFIDMLNALAPIPGVFAEGGHDYRLELPEAVREVWRLDATADQMTSMQAALRRRELGWEVKRRWMEAQAVVGPEEREKAVDKVLADVSDWTQSTATPADVERIIAQDCQPT